MLFGNFNHSTIHLMKRLFISVLTLTLVCALTAVSCKKNDTVAPGGEVENPDTSGNGSTKREVAIWVDLANVYGDYGRFHDTIQIKATLDTLKEVGITTLVVGVKSASGYTIYPSNFTKKIVSQNGKSFPANVDYLAFMTREAKKRNLKILASTNVFVEGDDKGTGLVYEDANYKNYQAVVCRADGKRVPITSEGMTGFVNPAIPEVQAHAIDLLKELVQKYEIDGIVLDYCRYHNIDADFSDFSKNEFIKFLQDKYGDNDAKNMKFPEDVVTSWKTVSGEVVPDVTGKYYKRWLLWRVKVIYDFVKKARAEVKSVRPTATFGSYVGSWYGTYYQVGVNWASQNYDPFSDSEVRFDWAYPDYNKYGYVEELDLLMTGNYSSQIMINDNPASAGMTYHWWSVEGSVNGGKYVTRNKVPLYGSIDMGNVTFAKKEDISKAMKLILSKTSNLMLFDVVHVYAPQYNRLKVPLWSELREGLKK